MPGDLSRGEAANSHASSRGRRARPRQGIATENINSGRPPFEEDSVVKVEFILFGDRVPILVSFLEDRIEQGAHDLTELLDFRAKTRQFAHEFFVGRRHSQPLYAAITEMVLIFCLRFLILILVMQSSGIFDSDL